MGDQGIGTLSLLKRRHLRWRTSVNLDSSTNSGRRYAVDEKTRPQEMDMSKTIRLVAVAMLAILVVGCGGGKDASATKASEAAGKAMDSAADAAASAKDAASASADAMAEGAKTMGDAASNAMDSAADTAGDMADDATATVNNAMDAASDSASSAADSASAGRAERERRCRSRQERLLSSRSFRLYDRCDPGGASAPPILSRLPSRVPCARIGAFPPADESR